MAFLSPLALLALLPWAAVAWRMLRARGEAQQVPFLALWPKGAIRAPRRGWRLPPPFVWLSLLGMLLAILAAARPMVTAFGLGEYRLSILLDRGATMSAQAGHQTRLAQFLSQQAELLEALGHGTVVRAAPEDHATAGAPPRDWSRVNPPPSAARTDRLLITTIRQERARGRGVLVITDQSLALEDANVFRIGPQTAPPDVALTTLTTDGTRVLMSVHNASDAAQAQLTIIAGDHAVSETIDLPPRGRMAQVEVTVLPPDAEPVDGFTAELTAANDAWAGNNRLAIARTRAWPRVEADPGIPGPVLRLVNTFTQLRPPRPYSRILRVATDPLPPDQAGVILPNATAPLSSADASAPPSVKALAFTAGLDANRLRPTHLARYPFPDDPTWVPVLTRGAHVLLAIRDSAAGGPRQVWVGFTDPAWEQSPDFVRFWTDLLLWLNGGAEAWSSQTISQEVLRDIPLHEALGRVGIEFSPTGPVALNLPPVAFPDPAPWETKELTAWLARHRHGREVGVWMIFAALLALTAAAWTWPRRYRA